MAIVEWVQMALEDEERWLSAFNKFCIGLINCFEQSGLFPTGGLSISQGNAYLIMKPYQLIDKSFIFFGAFNAEDILSFMETAFPLAQTVEHGTSNGRFMGSIPRECM